MSGLNDVLIAAHNDDVAQGGSGFLQDVVEFTAYGIPSAAISGGVGVWNSLKGVANAFGADLPMTRTEDVISDVVSSDGRNYYVDHKAGADVAGFAGTAVASGLGAVKALRMWQAGGKLSAGAVNATGIANADIVLASSQVQAYRAAIVSNPMSYGWNSKGFLGALGAAASQNVKEMAVAEAAFMLSHNQSAVLNPEGLSAWDSSKRATLEALPITAAFTGLGIALDGFRIIGYGRRAFDAEVKRAGTANAVLDTPLQDAMTSGGLAGDRMADALLGREALERSAVDGTLDIADDVQRTRYNGAAKQLQVAHDRALLEAMDGGDGALMASGREFSAQVSARTDSVDKLSMLGNLRSIVRGTLDDLQRQWNFFGTRPAAAEPVQGMAGSALDELQALRELTSGKIRGSARSWEALRDFTYAKGAAKQLAAIISYAERIGGKRYSEALTKGFANLRGRKLPELSADEERLLVDRGFDMGKVRVHPDHAEDFLEAISMVVGGMQHTDFGASLVRAFPALARSMGEAATAKPIFEPVRAYYNVRTGKAATGAALRAQDIGKLTDHTYEATLSRGPGAKDLNFAVDGRKTVPAAVLQRLSAGDLEDLHAPLDISAQWAVYAQRPLQQWAPPGMRNFRELPAESVTFTAPISDLPALERIATGMRAHDMLQLKGEAGTQGALLTAMDARQLLLQEKEAGRAAYQAAGINEQQIAVLLNTGEDFALGVKGADDAILMGKLDYSRPETVKLLYKSYEPDKIALSARTYHGLAARVQEQERLNAAAAHAVLGANNAQQLPKERLDLLQTLSHTDWTTGMINSADAVFGTFRQWAQYVGALAHKFKDDSRQTLNKLMLPHYQRLTAPGAEVQRVQLALLLNDMRTKNYTLVRLPQALPAQANPGVANVTHVAVEYETYMRYLQDWTQGGGKIEEADKLFSSAVVLDKLVQARTGRLLHRDVGELMEMHKELNTGYVANDRLLASARGKTITRSPHILYPPPLNLERTPHFVFVRPKPGVEMPSYMIYAHSAQSLQEKIAYVERNYGGKFTVADTKDVKLYKQLRADYDEGKVFNEWDFDVNLQRMGTAGNIQPSTDVLTAESLDLLRNWHHTKRENQIMQALEVRYAATMNALKGAGEFFGAADSTAKLGARSGKLDVYTDTWKTMLDTQTYDGKLARMYRDVQAEIGSTLSQHLDTVGYSISQLWERIRRKEKGFSMDDFDKLNAVLTRNGFENPYDDLGTMLTRSALISDGRTLGQATRALNTLVATTSLRADLLNTFTQVVSMPILYSGVVREAKRALAGTPAGRRLRDMTTVVNPANGVREPSAAKLFMNATKEYFTDAGRRFGDELRSRAILTDYQREFLDASDFSSLNGRHTLMDVQDRLTRMSELVGKYSGHQRAEDFTRFVVAHALKEIGELRGMQGEELYGMIRNGVDKMHGIMRKNSRVQLFTGVVGQSMGLFQTYSFNYAHRLVRQLTDGHQKDAALTMFLQGTMFGVRSLPGFALLNGLVAKTNSGALDIYTLAGTDHDPTGFGSYVLYGLGSNLSIIPTDAFSRGDIVLRHATVVPVNPLDWPAVSMLAKFAGAVTDAGRVWNETGDWQQALAYGMAHNALNRPLQGIGTAWLGAVTTNSGTPMFANANYRNYQNNGEWNALLAHPGWDEASDLASALNWSALGARIMGGKPRDEAVLMDSYYRRTAYQSEMRAKTLEIGEDLRVLLLAGKPVSDEVYTSFATRYEEAGGLPENFGQFFSRTLAGSQQSSVEEFRNKMLEDSAFSRTYNRLREERSEVPLWQLDAVEGGTP